MAQRMCFANIIYVSLMVKGAPQSASFNSVSQSNFARTIHLCSLLRPKCQSSGFEVEANVSFEDCYLHSQRTDINKRGMYVQVSDRGTF